MARQKNLLRAGDIFAQKYVILGLLGEGGMGVVYEAEHTMLAQRVAIKMLKDFAKDSDEFLKRFGREARASAKLRGAHVARVYDVDLLPDGTPYMVLEYLDGHCLGAELDARGRLPIGEAVNYVLEACSAMAEAHAYGIIHRDLKPSNLYFANDKTGSRMLKVLDFGISKSSLDDEVSVTMTQSSLGTPMYMSPEQIRSAKHVDKRTDIWSLGVILYEMLLGHGPFEGESPSAIIAAVASDPVPPPREKRPEIPVQLEAIVMRALAKRAEDRFDSIEDLAEALVSFAHNPDAWAPASIASSRGSLPSFPNVGSMDVTLAEGSVAVDDSISEGRPALTADRTRIADPERALRAPTAGTFTSDSQDRRGASPLRRFGLPGLGVLVAGATGFFLLARDRPATPDGPASVSSETESAPAPRAAPGPAVTEPDVAPALPRADASSAPPEHSAAAAGAAAGKRDPRGRRAGALPAPAGPTAEPGKPGPAPVSAPPPAPKATPAERHPLTL